MNNEFNLSKLQIDTINKFKGMKYIYKSNVSKYTSKLKFSREDEQQIYDVFKDLKGDNFIDLQ